MTTNLLGRGPNQVPFNSDLGSLAYQNHDETILKNVDIKSGTLNGIHTGTGSLSQLSITSTLDIGTKINIKPYDDINGGTISFEGSEGQLFSVNNNLVTGSIFSVNDISGIPSIDVDANGTISLAEFGGNVGIGTNNPTRTLHVNGTSQFQDFIYGNSIHNKVYVIDDLALSVTKKLYFDSGSNTYIHEASDDTLAVVTGGTERFRIDSSGNFGVGTATPSTLLHIAKSSAEALRLSATGGNQNIRAVFVGGSPSTAELTIGVYGAAQGAGGFINQVNSASLEFSTNNTERMRITNGGNVCINSTGSDNSTGGPLCITGRSAQGMSTWNIGSNGYPALYFNNASGSKVGDIIINSSSTDYNTSSDYRLKENVVGITDGITRVKQLSPSRFNFIADADTTVDGFLAHEAQTVVPEAVSGTKDQIDDDGNAVMQGIDQSKLVPLLTAAIKELITEVETLKAKVQVLEG